MSTLFDLQQGEAGIIVKVKGRGAFRKRITEMGFVKGKEVIVIKSAPLADPIEYKIMGYNVSLRRSESRLIEVMTKEEALDKVEEILELENYDGTLVEETLKITAGEKGKIIDIALVGNPNSGKTTLFNFASGSREHVGNFSGVTVDSKTAGFKQNGYSFNITDLPGTYSLTAYSPEEIFVRKHILANFSDIVVNVVDASNIERNLFLTTQLIDMDIRVVMALNMYDELEQKGDHLDHIALGQLLGIPVIPTVSSRGSGIRELFDRIIEVYEDRDPVVRHVHINYGQEIERSLKKIQDSIWKDQSLTDRISSRYYGIKLLEKDPEVLSELSALRADEVISVSNTEIKRLENTFEEDSNTLVTDAKYGFIAGALKETMKVNTSRKTGKTKSEAIDTFLTHKILGFPIFIAFLWLMFESTFVLGEFPKQGIEWIVGNIGHQVNTLMPPGSLRDLLVDGIISGIGSIIVFLPNILILFFFISLMEDTGYMARAAFIMDKLMHKIGLHGQSFIPLIMGFGCNVPAIMTIRTLKDRNDRLLTMLINPFMSCSARLPVYLLITGALFPKYAGTVIFCLYLTGILLAIIISIIFKKILFKSKEAPFVMELPPYRMPTVKVIFRHSWDKGQHYLSKMGGVILIAVILIWALEYFPRGEKSTTPEQQLTNSYIGKIGRTIEPVIRPLGFDWRMGVSLITGAAAKEVAVSTMGVLFSSGEYHETVAKPNLATVLQTETYHTGPKVGQKVFSPIAGISYLLFILIYMPCIAVIATVRKESASWKWTTFLIVYTTSLAWLLSFAIYQVGSLFLYY
ncbi:MAG: ferrous iron transport protein B [Bacteroidetes bacterium]|nr:ferrous iron transport protein B [Bacteroidota bacterium]